MATAPDFPFGPERITHVTPIEWKCVILYDAIKIDPAKPKTRNPKCAFLHGPVQPQGSSSHCCLNLPHWYGGDRLWNHSQGYGYPY